MASSVHMATVEDDQRHTPGPDSKPLWNESFWFAFYDPGSEIGATIRVGIHPNRDDANIYLFLTHRGEVVHSIVDYHAPVPPMEDGRLALHGYTIEWTKPLESFRLRYEQGWHSLDVTWEGFSPTYLYAFPPESTSDQVPRHIEHAGKVRGTITIAGTEHSIDCFGHRDHSWGGERDWSKMHQWDYLSGEIGEDFWFNAVRIALEVDGKVSNIYVGGLWDGNEVLNVAEVKMDVRTADEGTRALGVDLRIVDERRREHHIVSEELLAVAPAQFARTWVKDGFARYRYGDRIGYGILEHGYIEGP